MIHPIRAFRSGPAGRRGRTPLRPGLFAAVVALALAPALASASTAAAAADELRLGRFERAIDVPEPRGLDFDAEGTLWVASGLGDEILAFAGEGEPVARVGSTGSGPGQIRSPRGLDVDAGEIFVVDAGNDRVQVFGVDGTPRRRWGSAGSGPGEFRRPTDILVVGERVYVADTGNARVQVFDRAGARVGELRPNPDANAHANPDDGADIDADALALRAPVALAADDAGAIYVADELSNRVFKFAPDGAFIKAWGDWGPFVGLFDEPTDLAFHAGELFVVDRRNHRVQTFAPDGTYRRAWGQHERVLHEGRGWLHYPETIAIDPRGAVAALAEPIEDRIQLIAHDPTAAELETSENERVAKTQTHFGTHLDSSGNLLAIAEAENHALVLFDLSRTIPIKVASFGERGEKFGLLHRIVGLELDVFGPFLYVTDPAAGRLQQYRLDYDFDGPLRFQTDVGRLFRAYDASFFQRQIPAEAGPPDVALRALERGPDGAFYLIDGRHDRVLVFDENLRFARAFGAHGTGDGKFLQPTDLAFGRDGTSVFVVDSLGSRVNVFDLDGTFRYSFGGPDAGPRAPRRPFGIAAGVDGRVYVTDPGTDRVLAFDEEGTFLHDFGGRGVENGQLWKPRDVDQHADGRLFVIDHGNHRAQIFSPEGDWLVTFGMGRAQAAPSQQPQ